MIKTIVFFSTASLAAVSFADNSDCGQYVEKLESATTITRISGPSVAKEGERSQKIRDAIAESKKNGLSDCEILKEIEPLLYQSE